MGFANEKTKYSFLIVLAVLIVMGFLMTSCSSKEKISSQGELFCTTDSDCIPKPVCHPLTCINKNFADQYDSPDICTMVYVENAAHSPDDCLCINNRCINKNNQGTVTNENSAGARLIELPERNNSIDLPREKSINQSFSFKRWLFQLQGATYSSLLKADVDLAVIDPDETSLSKDDIGSLNYQDKLVLAYLSIGEAESYRSYWNNSWSVGNPRFVDSENPDWPGNYKVHFWDPEWQKIIIDRAKTIARNGYNGLYLDIIDAYEYYEAKGRETSAQEMIDFVKQIAKVTKSINPDFLIVPQNSPELYSYSDYASSIDGLGKEDTWFNERSAVDKDKTKTYLRFLDKAVADGKFVLSIDYPLSMSDICIYYSRCSSHKFACTVSNRDLDLKQPISCRD